MAVTIRSATPTDVPIVLDFVRELSEYLRAPGAVVATDQCVTDALFGLHPTLYALVAEQDKKIVGIATYFFTFSTWLGVPSLYLEALLVRQSVRGTGIGRQMMARLARIALTRGCSRMDWSVHDWNTPTINFYTKLGAVPQSEQTGYRLAGDALTVFAEESV
jgi:GNAT superfamily N-acetyltransferase